MAQRPCLDFLLRELVASRSRRCLVQIQAPVHWPLHLLLAAGLSARASSQRSRDISARWISVDHHQQAQGFERPSRTDRSSQRAVPELFLCNNQVAKLCLRRIRFDRGHT